MANDTTTRSICGTFDPKYIYVQRTIAERWREYKIDIRPCGWNVGIEFTSWSLSKPYWVYYICKEITIIISIAGRCWRPYIFRVLNQKYTLYNAIYNNFIWRKLTHRTFGYKTQNHKWWFDIRWCISSIILFNCLRLVPQTIKLYQIWHA